MLIAGMMIAWGTLATQCEHAGRPLRAEWRAWVLNFAGIGLALYVFMADALRVAGQGAGALRSLLPTVFNWPLFSIALVLMAAPIFHSGRHLRQRRLVEVQASPTS